MRSQNNRQTSTTNNGTLAILTGAVLVTVPYVTDTVVSIYNLIQISGATDTLFSFVSSSPYGVIEMSAPVVNEIAEKVALVGGLQIANLAMNTLAVAGAATLAYGFFQRGQAKAAQGLDESSALINNLSITA